MSLPFTASFKVPDRLFPSKEVYSLTKVTLGAFPQKATSSSNQKLKFDVFIKYFIMPRSSSVELEGKLGERAQRKKSLEKEKVGSERSGFLTQLIHHSEDDEGSDPL